VKAYRAAILHCLGDPGVDGPAAVEWFEDGLLIVEDGIVAGCGAYDDLAPRLAGAPVETFPGGIITPGFIDLHIHLPQVDCIAAHGGQLLEWLENHVFPAEAAFADPAHAAHAAAFFVDELLRNGTTTALVFGSSHKTSVEALFAEGLRRDMRLIAGKVLMDRFSPPALADTVESGRRDTLDLITEWAGKGRLGYAVTPRYAVTSSDEQLVMASEILAAHPEVWLQTHMSENPAEVAEVGRLFPGEADYFSVYERFGLTGRRSVFAHCIHMRGDELTRMAATGSAAAFCPTSNLFLGSGLFDLERVSAAGVKVGMGTDVGAGVSYSILHTLGDAYKVGQLRGSTLDPFQAFYLGTLGGARALGLEARIGNLAVGSEADFLVLDPAATPQLARRTACARTLADRLFALTILGDDRVIARTYLMGEMRHARDGVACQTL
jgi:guanine deaminase